MNVSQTLGDTLQNLVSGLGGGKDKAVSDSWVFDALDLDQLIKAYRGDWVARKIIDVPAFDATRAWRSWQIPLEDRAKVAKIEKKFRVQAKIAQALIWGRLFGGAGVVIGIKGDNHEKELDVSKLKSGSLQFLHVMTRYDLAASGIRNDVTDPWYNEPEYYEFSSDTRTIRMHPSRIVRISPNQIPEIAGAEMEPYWGDSVLQSVQDAVKNASRATQGVASLIHEAKIDVIKVPNLMQQLGDQEYTQSLIRRFTLANTMKSTHNTLVMDSAEEWDRKQITFSQLADIVNVYMELVCGAGDIPITRMLGQSPTGLNNTGEGDLKNYYDKISASQNIDLSPALERLDAVLVAEALGAHDEDATYVWNPLYQMSEEELAKTEKTRSETAKNYAESGLFSPEVLSESVASQLVENETYPSFAKTYAEEKESVEAEIEPQEVDPDNAPEENE